MSKEETKSSIAFDEDVLERALAILKEKGVDTYPNQIKRVYEISTKYYKKILENEDYCSINLTPIGKAYYHLYDINKIKTNKKSTYKYDKKADEKVKKKAKEQAKIWQGKYDHIAQEYEKRRTGKTVGKSNLLVHILQHLRRAIKRRKISSQEVEEIQNNIE